MIKVGDILIPARPYLYCIRVDSVWTEDNDPSGDWWGPWDYPMRLGYSRFDLDPETRKPIFDRPDSGCARDFREIRDGVYRAAPNWQKDRPEYFRRWDPPQGELF